MQNKSVDKIIVMIILTILFMPNINAEMIDDLPPPPPPSDFGLDTDNETGEDYQEKDYEDEGVLDYTAPDVYEETDFYEEEQYENLYEDASDNFLDTPPPPDIGFEPAEDNISEDKTKDDEENISKADKSLGDEEDEESKIQELHGQSKISEEGKSRNLKYLVIFFVVLSVIAAITIFLVNRGNKNTAFRGKSADYKRIQDYVNNCRESGYTDEAIEERLLESGYEAKEIYEFFQVKGRM